MAKKTTSFEINRGVKQGDPLSPLLFTFIIEILQNFAKENTMELFAPVIGGQSIPILLFADDVSLLTTNSKGVDIWLKVLEKFKLATGLELNINKTHTVNYPKNAPACQLKDLSTFTYLGIQFNAKGMLQNIEIPKICENLKKWYRPSRNIFSKVSILKSYAWSQIFYQSFVTEINVENVVKDSYQFLWGVGEFLTNKKRVLVNKKRAEMDYLDGGLNIWDLKARLLAFKASIIERVIHGDPSKLKRIWKESLSKESLWKLYKGEIPLPSHNAKAFLEAWIMHLPKNLNEANFLEIIKKYRTIGMLALSANPKAPKTYTPRQTKLRSAFDLRNVFGLAKNFSGRNSAYFLWKYLQGGLEFNHKINCARCTTHKMCHTTDCQICKHNKQSYIHLFFTCNTITSIIQSFFIVLEKILGSRTVLINNVQTIIEWEENSLLLLLSKSQPNDVWTILILSTLKTIWRKFTAFKHDKHIKLTNWFWKAVETNMSAAYTSMLESSSVKNRTSMKNNFFEKWNIPQLWTKYRRCFAPKKSLRDLVTLL